MSQTDKPVTDGGTYSTSGWDKDAFWYPTLDKRGALLALAIVLFILHFDELFGLHTSKVLVFGWLPIEMAYQIFQGFLHVGFMYLLYLNWPSPTAELGGDEPEIEEVVEDVESDIEEIEEDIVGGDD